MNLSNYCDEKEQTWKKNEQEATEKLVNYLNQHIDEDLYQIANTYDSVELFQNLKVWLLKFYPEQLLEGIKTVGNLEQRFQRSLIYSLILGVTRDSSNVDVIYDVLKQAKVIEKMLVYDEGFYEIITENFGTIPFMKADVYFQKKKDLLQLIEKMDENIRDRCHEVTFEVIKNYEEFQAVTAICEKGLNENYYHSYLLDADGDVVDFTANLFMPREQYELLQGAEILNSISYQEYLKEKDQSVKYDESKTLYDLLRNAVYKQYQSEHKKK